MREFRDRKMVESNPKPWDSEFSADADLGEKGERDGF